MISFGASTSGIVVPGSPGCLPGRRPEDCREERRTGLRYGESELGGLLDVEESLPNCRSSAAIRAFCASTTPRSAALSRRSSQTSAHSCPTDDPAGTGGSSDTNHHDQHTHTVIKPTRRDIHTTTTDPHSLPARQVVNTPTGALVVGLLSLRCTTLAELLSGTRNGGDCLGMSRLWLIFSNEVAATPTIPICPRSTCVPSSKS